MSVDHSFGVAIGLQSFADIFLLHISVMVEGADSIASGWQGSCHCILVGKGLVG